MIQERKDHKNLIIGLLVILVIALAFGNIYFAFIKKDETPVNNGNGKKQEEIVIDSKELEDNTEFEKKELNAYIKKLKSSKEIVKVEYELQEALKPNEVELTAVSDGIIIKLSDTGEISIKFDENDVVKIKNVTNVKDFAIISFDTELYMITDSGDVYKYLIKENKYKDMAVKLTNIKNADKFISIGLAYKKYQGGDDLFGVVDKDNNYIELSSYAN